MTTLSVEQKSTDIRTGTAAIFEMWLYIGEEEGLKGYWFLPEKCMVMNFQGGSVRRLHRWNWWLG